MYLNRTARLITAALLLAITLIVPTAAAQEANVCTETTDQSLTLAGINCSDLDTNTVCYGSPTIESIFANAANEDAFSEPGDIAAVSELVTLRPGAINTSDKTWGIAVINVQASLPSGFEDDVVIIGLGGAEIEAGVTQEDAFVPAAPPVSFTTSAAGELRAATLTAPQLAEVVTQVPGSSTVLADAISQNGEWVRVIHNEQPGWLSVDALSGEDLSGLPVLSDGQLTAMQSFYMRTGIDHGACAPESSWVFVQGPQQIPVDVVINNVTIRIESTIALRTLIAGEPVGRQLEILVVYGLARINPDTPDEIVVPAGYTLTVNYGPDLVSFGIEGDADERGGPISFDGPRLVTQRELDDVDIINELPPEMFNYSAPPPILVTPSGIGGPIIELIFEDPIAIVGVEALCQQGLIPVAICQVFGFDTP